MTWNKEIHNDRKQKKHIWWETKKYIWLETKEVHMTGNKRSTYDLKQKKYIWQETKQYIWLESKEVHKTGNKRSTYDLKQKKYIRLEIKEVHMLLLMEQTYEACEGKICQTSMYSERVWLCLEPPLTCFCFSTYSSFASHLLPVQV